MRIAFFTGGSLGAGHLMRGLAIGRALERNHIASELRMFVPVEPFPVLQPLLSQFSPEVCPVDPDELFEPESAEASQLAQALLRYAPDVLIVDLFWAPVIHVLPLLSCEAWLIVRSCPPTWFDGTSRAHFASSAYSRVIGIEPLGHSCIREFIDPIVVCNPGEAKSRRDVCERWSIAADAHITAITHAGLPQEIDRLQSEHRRISIGDRTTAVIRSDMRDPDAVVPFAPWLPAVDQVFCAAGYNSYWEARWMGYAEKTVITAIPRRIDDPLQRIRSGKHYVMKTNGADELALTLRG